MARPLRLEFPGAVYCVSARGNHSQPIFADEADREIFLEVLAAVVEKHRWICHAYCLMHDFYRLLIETPQANLSRGMRQLNGVYTQSYNKKHGTFGHLLQGRFASIVLEKESFLLKVCREIVLGPVRCREVNHPRAWKWSSYPATVGIVRRPFFLSTDWIAGRFSSDRAAFSRAFSEFVMAGISEPEPWEEVRGRILLGNDAFVETMGKLLKEKPSLEEVPRAQRTAARPLLARIFETADGRSLRDRAMHRAHVEHGYTLKEIGRHLGVHYSTVSKAVKRAQAADCG